MSRLMECPSVLDSARVLEYDSSGEHRQLEFAQIRASAVFSLGKLQSR